MQPGKVGSACRVVQVRVGGLPDIAKPVFGFAILPRNAMIRRKSSLGERPRLLKVTQTESVDMDTLHDFEVVEFLYKKNKL